MKLVEALKMAVTAIRTHKLRSFLTLVGIIAGVSSIIAVMTGISVIQTTFEKELSVLGTRAFQVQKWAAGGPISDEEFRKIQKRRPTTVEHADAIRERVRTVDLVGSELWDFGHVARYRDVATNTNLSICGGTPEYSENNTHYIESGRNLTEEDIRIGRNVVVLGHAVAEHLFPWIDPLQQVIKIDRRKYTVVGTMEEKKSALGANFDNYLLIPITAFKKVYGERTRFGTERSVNITVRAKSSALLREAIEETRSVMRMERGLKPGQEDDFTIYTNDSQINEFNRQTANIKVGSFAIGIVALIVAGIGIMNIMLVSVTERTQEIGIRKSLGAKRRNILTQFLMEAVILSNFGGMVGVLVGFGLGNVVSILTHFQAHVPLEWALVGLLFCTAIGLVFGIWPAMKASKMDPITALRYE